MFGGFKKLIQAKIQKNDSFLRGQTKKLLESIYLVFYFMLKNPLENFWWECISIITQNLDVFLYSTDRTFYPILKKTYLTDQIFSIFIYDRLSLFLKTNAWLYPYIFFSLFGIITILFILFIVMAIIIKKRKYNTFWPLIILRYGLPILSTFYSQLFYFLCLAFNCKNDGVHDIDFPCLTGSFHELQLILAAIMIILSTILCFMTETYYYKPYFIKDGKDVIVKHSSISGRIFLFSKILIITSFVIENRNETYHWLFIFELILVTLLNAYCSIAYYSYENKSLYKLHRFCCIINCWSYLTLLIGKIFLTWKYNGTILVFLFGFVLIAFLNFYEKDKNIDFAMIDFESITTSKERVDYIRKYMALVHNKDKFRDISIILRTLIEKREAGCVNNNCALKKYLNSLNNDINSDFFLFLFAQNLFESSMSRFPNNIELKINYVVFLLTEVNKKTKAKKQLSSIETSLLNLEDNFNIFRIGKYIDEYNSNTQNKNEILNKEILLALEYKKYTTEFKKLLSKVSNLYHEFWYSIFGSHIQGTEDFKKLNDIGAEINELLEEVDKSFENLFQIKNNDSEILKLYASFAKEILNDNEKYIKYHDILVNLCAEKIKDIKNIDYSNFDMKILNETDEYQYLIVSANPDNLGTIINMSLNLSTLFCYHKNEIISKHINILLPEILHKTHNKILHEFTENIKTKFYENFTHKITYYPECIEKFVYSKNKLKYLIPLFLRIYFVLTEENEHVFIIEVNRQEQETNNYFLCSEDIEYSCCILTDLNLLIQSFTPASMEILGLNSKLINSNYEVTQFIKEFNDDFYNILLLGNNEISELEGSTILSEIKKRNSVVKSKKMSDIKNTQENYILNMPIEKKLKIKRKLIKEKYSFNRKITWNIPSSFQINKNSENHFQNIIKTLSSLKTNSNEINTENSKPRNNINSYLIEKECFMKVNEVIMDNKLVGYKFLFKPILNKQSKIQRNKNQRFSAIKVIDIEPLISPGPGNIIKTKPKFSADGFKNKATSFSLKDSRKKSNKKNIFDDLKDVFNSNDYIPKCNFNFYLDTDKLSYFPSNIIVSPEENIFLNNLRNEAFCRINNFKKVNLKTKKEITNSNSYNSEKDSSKNSDYESNEEEESSISISSLDSDDITSKIKVSDKNNLKRLKSNSVPITKNLESQKYESNDYYKVNVNKIRFMIFDFNKEMIIDNLEEKKSQMEKIMNNSQKDSLIYLNEDMSFLKIPNKIPRSRKNSSHIKNNYKNDSNINDDKNKIKNSNLNTFSLKYNKKWELEKEVSEALIRDNTQNEVFFLTLLSFLLLILIYAMSFYELYFIKIRSSKIKKLYRLFVDATDLRYWTSYSIYYLREITLLNMEYNITNGTYINFPAKNKTLYKNFLLYSVKNAFKQGHSCAENIAGSNLKFSEETNYELNVKIYSMKSLLKNYKLKNINITLTVSMLQLYASLFNLVSNQSDIQQNNEDLYNFLYNALNSMNDGLEIQLKMLLKEFFTTCRKYIKIIVITLFIFLILYIICYIIIVVRFIFISKRKISYINVFFGISLSLIKSSISKCEKFINGLNKDDEYVLVKEEYTDIEEDVDLSSSNKINKFAIDNNEIKSNKKTKHKKIKGDAKIKFFRIVFFLILLFSFVFLSVILLLYLKLINNIIVYGKYDLHMQKLHINFLELFNSYREFLFDNESIISNKKCLTHLKNLENKIYSEITEDNAYLDKNYIKLGPDLIEHYYENNSTCSLMNNYYFTNKTECEKYYGPVENAGDPTFLIYFVDEIRIARNLVSLFLEQNLIIGNLTKFNESFTNEILDTNKSFIFRLELFNMKNTHKELNLYFSNKIFPNIDAKRNVTLTSIQSKINGIENLFYILAGVHMVLFFLIFIFIWIPIVGKINTSLNKTKNMLTIIPVKILAMQPGIKILLDIKEKNNN